MSEIISSIINGDLGHFLIGSALSSDTSVIEWILFFVACAIVLCFFWIAFCCATRIRFLRGTFYTVSFRNADNGLGCVVRGRTPQNANKNSLFRYLLSPHFLVPFSVQSTTVMARIHRAKFKAVKSPVETFSCRSYPYSDAEANAAHFNKGHLSRAAIRAILNRDTEFVFDEAMLQGTPLGESDRKMDFGTYLVEEGTNTIVFFITKKEEQELRN